MKQKNGVRVKIYFYGAIFFMLSKTLLGKFDTFIFDLDGTFWWYTKVVEGGEKIYKKLQDLSKKVIFVSNFTLLDRDEIVKVLRKNGILATKEQIITSSLVASKLLKGKSVFPIGKGLEDELRKNGVKIAKNEKANIVVVGHDINFDYKKASIALNILLRKNSEFYTTAYGRLWILNDKTVPGTGLIVSGLEYCSKRRAILLGKPSKFMLEEVKKASEGKAIYFGDEIKADIEFANKAGFYSVFVKEGIDKKISRKSKPKAILNSLKDLLKFL